MAYNSLHERFPSTQSVGKSASTCVGYLQNDEKFPLGSASETEYQLLLARDLEFLPNEQYQKLHNDVTEVKRMLTSFMQTLRADR